MIRAAVAVLFVLHGVIHLFGVVRGSGLADVALLSVPISPLMGVLWLAATLLCVAAAAAVFLAPRWWWAVGIGAVVVSQVVIVSSWADAAVGTVANVVLLVAVLYGFVCRGPLSLRAELEHDLGRALTSEPQPPRARRSG